MLQKSNKVRRKGMILLVVVAFLALFSVMGLTYLIYADSQLRQSTDEVNGQDARQDSMRMVDLNPSFLLNFFLERFLYDQADVQTDNAGNVTNATPYSMFSALRGHSLARNIYGANDNPNAIMDKAFSGTGKLNKTVRLNEADNTGASDLPEWMILNYAYPGQTNNMATVYMDPERIAVDTANNNRLISNRYPGNKTSSWNAPYTYPDQNNVYLGWVSSDGTKILPSFYRPGIFGAMDKTNLPVAGAPPTGNMEWINNVGKFKSLRPRPVDHLSTADFNSAGGNTNNLINIINTRISESKLFPYPEADGFDVKNLEGLSSGNDSIWIDVGSPIFKAPDGRKYKILIAPLVLDLDGRINLNVAGNNMAGGNHGSNQGWGPWEINPAKIAQVAEIQAMINSYPNPGQIDLPGRYTGATRYPSGTNGANLVLPKSPSYAMVDYNGAVDLGAAGGEGYFKTSAFNDPDVVPFQSFPYFPSKNYGAAGNNEVSDGTNYNHASIYNPLRPTTFTGNLSNRVFSAKDTATLLNIKAARSNFAASASAQFLPSTFDTQNKYSSNPQVVKNRNLFTTVSSDLARISTPPYLVNSLASPYQMTGNYPRGNPVAYMPPGTPIPAGGSSDVDTYTTMGNTLSGSLASVNGANRKIDLARKLTDYPNIDYTFTGGVGGNGGRFANLNNLNSAVSERQIFADEIFQALRNATGARDVSNVILPVLGAPTINNGQVTSIPIVNSGANYNPASIRVDVFGGGGTGIVSTTQFDMTGKLSAINITNGGMNYSAPPVAKIVDSDYEANRYLAQLAANMVDYTDNDDVSTAFTWKYSPGNTTLAAGGVNYTPYKGDPVYWVDSSGNMLKNMMNMPVFRDPSGDERVFGQEANKLVINEVYSEIINDPTDTFPEDPPNSNKHPADKAKKFQVHFWLEMVNPLTGATNGSLVNHAILEQDPRSANGDSSVYQLEIRDKSVAPEVLRSDNPLGISSEPPKSLIPNFQDEGAGNFYQMVEPVDKSYLGTEPNAALNGKAKGFFVLGSKIGFPNDSPNNMETPKPFTNISNMEHIKKSSLKYDVDRDATDPSDNTKKLYDKNNIIATIGGVKPSILLKRLANPYMPPEPDATKPNYNPYVTVDMFDGGLVNDAITNDADDKRVGPPPTVTDKAERTSVNRQQPIQDMTKKSSKGQLQGVAGNPISLSKQPQHTFQRHNGSFEDVPVTGIDPVKETILKLPFVWNQQLDRNLASVPELLHVSGVAPKTFTQAFNNPAITDGTNPIGHKAPWLDGASRLARFLEFVQVKSRQTGVAQDGKQPGLININSIWDVEVFRALADARQTYDPKNPNNFIEPEVDAVFNAMLASRSPNNMPAMGDNPFWSFGVGQANGGDEWTGGTRGLNNTILRNNGGLFDLQNQNTNVQDRDAYQKKELLNKVFNSITTKSNTFGIWLTTGYFEVTDDTVMPPKLGAEIGKSEGTNIRHRMFAIVDRTNFISGKCDFNKTFDTNQNGKVEDDINGLPLGQLNFGNPPVLVNPQNNKSFALTLGMNVVLDANTDYEETIPVILDANGKLLVTPQKLHYPTLKPANAPAKPNPYYQNTIKTISLRGNPGPWAGYDRTKDKDVVIYSEIIE